MDDVIVEVADRISDDLKFGHIALEGEWPSPPEIYETARAALAELLYTETIRRMQQ